MAYRLRVVFEDPDSFRKEFERNIAMGGAFLPTSDPLELRSFVDVEFVLSFCDESVILEAEVVHLIPPEHALNPADAGVAVSFRKPASEIRAMFEPCLTEDAAESAFPAGAAAERATTADAGEADPLLQKPRSSAQHAPRTRFEVISDGVDPSTRSDIEVSVLELAGAGFELGRILEIIPEESVDVLRVIEELIDREALAIADPTTA